jgi:hypothetical protein
VASLQAAVTTVDGSMVKRVGESYLRRNAVCLERDGGSLEHPF